MSVLLHRVSDRLGGILDRTAEASHVDRQRARQVSARDGAVDLTVTAGELSGTVVLDRRAPSKVRITIEEWPEDAWTRVLDVLAGELRLAGELLGGTVPSALTEHLDELGLSLLPPEIDAWTDDESTPWRAIGALWMAWARRCDNDPFLLLAPRGKDRVHVLAELRARRAGGGAEPVPVPRSGGVTLVQELDPERLYAADGLDQIAVKPRPPEDPTALLRHLGTPPGVPDDRDLERLIIRAAETAWTLAADEGSDEADDEVLLAELRARGMATADALATAVGWEADRAREVLDRLYDAGTVMRGGSGPSARYRA